MATTTIVPELIHPSAVASFLQVAFNPRKDIEVNGDGSSVVHSSDEPHRIYEASEHPKPSKKSEASTESEGAEEFDAVEEYCTGKESNVTEESEESKRDEFIASLKARSSAPGPDEPSLHVFLTGTGAPALARDKCKEFLSTSVPFGVTTIALSYEWLTLADSVRNSMIDDDWSMDLATKHAALKLCHDDICFGTQEGRVSMAKTGAYHQVNLSECITQRLVRLLTYLHFQNPDRGWDTYLLNITEEEALSSPSDSIVLQGEKSFIATINWSKIILSGHSQGAGHAAFIAMHKTVGRVALFSGPQEGLEDGFYEADKQHWLSKEIATPAHCWFALKHANEEDTARLILDNWAVMPAFKEKHMYGLDIVKIQSTSWGKQVSEIRALRRRNQTKPRLFETFLPYEGYEEGVEKPGRPYHCSTIMDDSVPLIDAKSGGAEDGQQIGDIKTCVYKKIIWPFILIGDRGIMNVDPSEFQGYWKVRTEADLLPGGLLPEDNSKKAEFNVTTPLKDGRGVLFLN